MFKEFKRNMEKISSGIGVAIITYNRPDYYKRVLESIPRNMIDFLVVVNDGYDIYTKDNDAEIVIQTNKQMGVAVSKNYAIKVLVEKFNCEHIFLIEDDIIIKRPDVFEAYIKAANSTGIHHLCYEKVAGNEKSLKYTLEQPDGVKLGFYHNPQGAFMYVNANILKKIGYFDENYVNAFEHIDFAYSLIQKNVAPPFWYFPDLLNSEDYITDIEGSNQNSSITNKEGYNHNWQRSAQYFIKKWGKFTNEIIDEGIDNLKNNIIFLQTNYSRKKNVNKNQKLTIVVPYRDRKVALDILIPNLIGYVGKQVENYEIIVVEQDDNNPFNKGKLNNIGFKLKSEDSTYVCFHDVDLIPEFSDYSYPERPSHLSSHCSQFAYINIPDKIMGGVITFKNEHYEQVNGFSNEYEGWGKEDDDLYLRCERDNIIPYKHPFGRYFSVPHKLRLSDDNEKEMHKINGKRYTEFSEGKIDIKNDGINTISNYKINEVININPFTKHYKIKYA
jgi:GT2 family glycosyltransferase